jgi:hypothetical protein
MKLMLDLGFICLVYVFLFSFIDFLLIKLSLVPNWLMSSSLIRLSLIFRGGTPLGNRRLQALHPLESVKILRHPERISHHTLIQD